MTFLTRLDPSRKINRFYVVQVMPTLFGDWAVLREWGRRGSPGAMRLSSYRRRDEAQIAEQRTIKRRLQHGYQPAKEILTRPQTHHRASIERESTCHGDDLPSNANQPRP